MISLLLAAILAGTTAAARLDNSYLPPRGGAGGGGGVISTPFGGGGGGGFGGFSGGAGGGGGPQIPIVRLDIQPNQGDGSYSYSYETGNGIRAEERGHQTGVGDNAGTASQGSYSYTGPDGRTYTVSYTADENGFRAVGDHLPTPPPIPPEIARALAATGQLGGGGGGGGYSGGGGGGGGYRAPPSFSSSSGYQY